MNCNEKGVGLTAAEVRVLNKFASKDDRNKKGVKIVVASKNVRTRATTGDISLEIEGVSDGQLSDGEWFVDRGFLESAVKLVVGIKAMVRLAFSGASLNHAIKEENDVETGSYDVPHDAALSDVSFPWANEGLKLPSKSRKIAHCSALPGAYAALLQEVEAAVEADYTDIYPPQSPEHPWVFECKGPGGLTVARGTLKAAKSAAAAKGDDEADEDEKPTKGKPGKRKQLELAK